MASRPSPLNFDEQNPHVRGERDQDRPAGKQRAPGCDFDADRLVGQSGCEQDHCYDQDG